MPSTSLERRLRKLEEERRSPKQLIGILSVDARESIRAVNFRIHGFHLNALDTPSEPNVPRICTDGIDFQSVLAKTRRMARLWTDLERLDRSARERFALKHGFRIVYPPAGPASGLT